MDEPSRIDALVRIALDPKEDAERVDRLHRVIRHVFYRKFYIERGALGIRLDEVFELQHVAEGSPAQRAGMQVGWRVLSIGGVKVSAKSREEMYRIIHDTRLSEVLEVGMLKQDGQEIVLRPVVAARSTVREDENVALHRRQKYEEWMEQKCKELGR